MSQIDWARAYIAQRYGSCDELPGWYERGAQIARQELIEAAEAFDEAVRTGRKPKIQRGTWRQRRAFERAARREAKHRYAQG